MVICTVSEVLVGHGDCLANNCFVRIGNFIITKNIVMNFHKAYKRWEPLKPIGLRMGEIQLIFEFFEGAGLVNMILSMALVKMSKSFFLIASHRASMSCTGTLPEISSRALGTTCPLIP